MGASILYAAAVIGIVGILAGILLGVASEKFKVKVDEKEIKVREALPGNNCGGCGYPGCDGLAAAIAKGEAKPDACPVGGEAVAKKIVEIVGGEIDSVRHVAHVKCARKQRMRTIMSDQRIARLRRMHQAADQRVVASVVLVMVHVSVPASLMQFPS